MKNEAGRDDPQMETVRAVDRAEGHLLSECIQGMSLVTLEAIQSRAEEAEKAGRAAVVTRLDTLCEFDSGQ